MSAIPRKLLRCAVLIHSSVAAQREASSLIVLRSEIWLELQKLCRQCNVARSRKWSTAERILRRRLEDALTRCRAMLDQIEPEFSRSVSESASVPALPQILEDLRALEIEYPESFLDLREKTISVTTDFIVIAGVELGRFEIRLSWDRIGRRHPYSVLALDPKPAPSSSNTFHPHVDGDTLCEGEGERAIRGALSELRLVDFFLLVDRVLHTHNPSSAYVPLAHWSGTPCSDCGAILDADSQYSCERCSDTFCGDCLYCCETCSSVACHGCRERCGSCGASLCRNCASSCSVCSATRCTNCLFDNNTCEESAHDPETFEDPETTPAIECSAGHVEVSPEHDAVQNPTTQAAV